MLFDAAPPALGAFSRTSRLRAFAVLFCGAAALAPNLGGCDDPTKDAIIVDLGDEQPGVPTGPLHRPGQPCLVCHDGTTSRKLAVGGTVYWGKDVAVASPGTTVELQDSRGAVQTAITNCAGNFFLFPEQIAVRYPFWVTLRYGDTELAMDSPINGDGSCAKCHQETLSDISAGRVYLYETPPGPAPTSCP